MTPAQREQRQWEAAQDARTRLRLIAQGLDPDRAEPDYVDWIAKKSWKDKSLAKWCIFNTHARREKHEAVKQIKMYADAPGHRRPGSKLYMLRLRSRQLAHMPVSSLREGHQLNIAELRAALKRLDRRFGHGRVIAYAVHHRPLARGEIIDVHFHALIEYIDADEFDSAVKYLEKKYDIHFDDAEYQLSDVERAANYMRSTTARYVDDFTDANLAEYVRQLYVNGAPLHRWQARGSFRQAISTWRANDVRPAIDLGEVFFRSTDKPVRWLCDAPRFENGPIIKGWGLRWNPEGELRPVLIADLRGHPIEELEKRYDLREFEAAALAALDRGRTNTISPDTGTTSPCWPQPVPSPKHKILVNVT